MPRLLDLYCGCGGAAAGYHQAGFDVVGVDYEGQRSWPIEWEFIMEDVPEFLERNWKWISKNFDAIHASPPCQRWSIATRCRGDNTYLDHPDLIGVTRTWLQQIGLPYVIENVPQAPLHDPVILCGTMFDLGVEMNGDWFQLQRHRAFETNWDVDMTGMECQHNLRRKVQVYGSSGRGFLLEHRQKAMGINWMINEDLKEAIPPAFTEFLGKQLKRIIV